MDDEESLGFYRRDEATKKWRVVTASVRHTKNGGGERVILQLPTTRRAASTQQTNVRLLYIGCFACGRLAVHIINS